MTSEQIKYLRPDKIFRELRDHAMSCLGNYKDRIKRLGRKYSKVTLYIQLQLGILPRVIFSLLRSK